MDNVGVIISMFYPALVNGRHSRIFEREFVLTIRVPVFLATSLDSLWHFLRCDNFVYTFENDFLQLPRTYSWSFHLHFVKNAKKPTLFVVRILSFITVYCRKLRLSTAID